MAQATATDGMKSASIASASSRSPIERAPCRPGVEPVQRAREAKVLQGREVLVQPGAVAQELGAAADLVALPDQVEAEHGPLAG